MFVPVEFARTTLLAAAGAATATSDGGTSGSSGGDGGSSGGSSGGSEPLSFSDAVDAAVTELQDLALGFVTAVPRVIVGALVFGLFWLTTKAINRWVRPRLRESMGESVGRIVTSLINAVVLGIGAFTFLSISFPSVNASTLLGGAGVLALAAGFAFQDILENLMAGILLIFRQPFRVGDTVDVEGAQGVVEVVTMRETRIKKFDRQEVVIPNAQVYKNAILVQTERDSIRSSVLVGVGYGENLQHAEDVAIEAVRAIEGVHDDPAVEAFYTEFGDSSINLDVRYFHGSSQHELRRVQGEVVKAIKTAFDRDGIDIPFPIRTLDMTSEFADTIGALGGQPDAGSTGGGSDGTGARAAAGADRSPAGSTDTTD